MRNRVTEIVLCTLAAAAVAPAFLRADDTRPAPEPVTFEAALEKALASNPSVTIAIEEITRAEAAVEQVRSSSFPKITGNATYTRLDGERRATSASPPAPGTLLQADGQTNANLNLTMPLLSTQSWLQWSHAKDNLDISKVSADEIKRQLAVSVARTCLALVTQHRVIEVSERARETSTTHHDFARSRLDTGYGNRVDEVRAAQEVANSTARVESAYAGLATLQEALGVLLGADHAFDIQGAVGLPETNGIAEAVSGARELRPDIRVLRLKAEAARRVSRDSWSDYMPTLTGSFQPFFQNPHAPQLPNTVPKTGWQAQFSLGVPIYDGGARYGNRRDRVSLEVEAQANLENGLRQAEASVRGSYEGVQRARSALAAAKNSAELAAQALSLTTLAYKAGATTNLEVIDAERQARDAETAVATAENAERQAVLDLLVASGRFPVVPPATESRP